MPELLVSAIIPAYRRPEKLRKAIQSLLAQDLDPSQFEVIVVDSSPDESNKEVVRVLQEGANCRLRLLGKQPEGPGPSRNLGASEARAPFLAFIDSDCVASPQWLREGITAFQDGIGLVQGRTIPEPGQPHSIFNYYIAVEKESFLYETCNMFYRREVFERSGGFLSDMDPRAERPRGGEDVDLAWRVKRAGWRSRFAPNALVAHEVMRINLWGWLFNKRLYITPYILRRYPELREFFFGRYFYNKIHAYLTMAVAAGALAAFTPLALVLTLPYIVSRATEPTRTLHGPLRLLRVPIYLVRDLISLSILVAGSLRYRSLLL